MTSKVCGYVEHLHEIEALRNVPPHEDHTPLSYDYPKFSWASDPS